MPRTFLDFIVGREVDGANHHTEIRTYIGSLVSKASKRAHDKEDNDAVDGKEAIPVNNSAEFKDECLSFLQQLIDDAAAGGSLSQLKPAAAAKELVSKFSTSKDATAGGRRTRQQNTEAKVKAPLGRE